MDTIISPVQQLSITLDHLAGGLASSGFGRGPMSGRIVAELVLGRQPEFDLTTVLPNDRVQPID